MRLVILWKMIGASDLPIGWELANGEGGSDALVHSIDKMEGANQPFRWIQVFPRTPLTRTRPYDKIRY